MFFEDMGSGSEKTLTTSNGLSPSFQAVFFFGSAEKRYRLLAGHVAAIAAGYEALFFHIKPLFAEAPTYAEDSDQFSQRIRAHLCSGS